jgi:DNA-binding XRE family transcriptional regulator
MKKQPKNRIAEERNARGMTQQELADAVGAHWITISKLERGRIKLTTEWLDKLAAPLLVNPSDLLPREERRFGLAQQGRPYGFAQPSIIFPEPPPSKFLSETKKFPLGKSQVRLTIDESSYEPLLHKGDKVTLMPWGDIPAGERRRLEGRLCFFDGGTKSYLGMIYPGKKSDAYDLYWLGGRVAEGVKAASIFLATSISFQLER